MMKIQLQKLSLSNIVILIYFTLYLTVSSTLALPNANILRWGGSFLLLAIGVLSKLETEENFTIWPSYFNYLLPTFIISIFTLDYAVSYGITKILSFILVIVALYLFMDRKIFTPEKIESAFSLMSHLLNLLIVYQFFLLISTGFELGGFSGIYLNKNMLTSFSLSALVGALWLLSKSPKKKTLILLAYVVPSTLVLIAAGSRIGFIGLSFIFLSTPFLLVESKTIEQKFKMILWVIASIVLGILIVKYVDIPALDRILSPEASDNSTGLSRGSVWEAAFAIVEEKPFFGWGFGSVNYHIFIDNLSKFTGWHVHNSYLVILIENGVVGSLFYILFFVNAFQNIRTKYKKIDEDKKSLVKFASLLCLVLLINGIAESLLLSVGNPMAIIFWYSLIAIDRYLNKLNHQQIESTEGESEKYESFVNYPSL